MECQSTPDGTMVIRMFEYDFAIAMEEARKENEPQCVKFPMSAVLYLRHNRSTPDRLAMKILFPDGQSVTYTVPVIKVQEYTLEEIFKKHLWLFLPYYIMRYEAQFDAMEEDRGKREAMLADLREMTARLEEQADNPAYGSICKDLIQLAKHVADYMLRKQRKTKKEVISIMGGKILELHSEKMLRKGRKIGRAEGRAEGEGRLSRLISLLLKNGKNDEIATAVEDAEARQRLYAEYGIL